MKILLVISLLLFSQFIRADLNEKQVAELLKYNVVKLAVKMENGSEENGFGWIIGQDVDRLFIVTADHVVRGEDRMDGPDRIDVRLFGDPSDFYAGTLSEASSFKDLDIAIVTIKPPNRQPWLYSAISENIELNLPVAFIGKSTQWFIPSQSGTLTNKLSNDEAQDNSYDLIARGLTAEVGSSGAPLISKNGIIGMIVEHSSEGTGVVSLQEIKKMVVAESKIKWDLLPFSAPSKLVGTWAPKTANVPADIRLEFSPLDAAHFAYSLNIPGEKTYEEGVGVIDGETVRMWQPLNNEQESYGTFGVYLDDSVDPDEVILMQGKLTHGNQQPTMVRLAKLNNDIVDSRSTRAMLDNPSLVEKFASRLVQTVIQNGTDTDGLPVGLNDDDAAILAMGLGEAKLMPMLYGQMANNGISGVNFSIRNIAMQHRCLVAQGEVHSQKQKDVIEEMLRSTSRQASQQFGNTYDICNETSLQITTHSFDFAAELARPQALIDTIMPGVIFSVEGECLLATGTLKSPMFKSLLSNAMADLAKQLSDKSHSQIKPCDRTKG